VVTGATKDSGNNSKTHFHLYRKLAIIQFCDQFISITATNFNSKHNLLRNCCISGLLPSYGILKNSKNTTFLKLDMFPSSGDGVGDTYYIGPVRKS
jgi:hypothetical protein